MSTLGPFAINSVVCGHMKSEKLRIRHYCYHSLILAFISGIR